MGRCTLRLTVASFLLGMLVIPASTLRAGPPRELLLPSFQAATLAADFPIRDLRFAGDEDLLWLLGRTALWKWDILGRRLTRTSLPEEIRPPQQLLPQKDALFISGPGRLFRFSRKTRDHRFFELPPDPQLQKALLLPLDPGFFWMQGRTIARIDGQGIRHRPTRAGMALQNGDLAAVTSGPVFWIARQGLLLRWQPGDAGPQVVHKNPARLQQLIPWAGTLFTHTGDTVLRFDHRGEMIRAIPVENNRRLRRMALQDQRHTYLFTDGLVETYDVDSATRHSWFPEIPGQGERVTILRIKGPLLAVVNAGHPHLYVLEQPVRSAPRIVRKPGP